MLDAPRADRAAVRRELGIGGDRPEGATVLVNVGRFDPGKGQELLVDVIAALARRRAHDPAAGHDRCPPVLLLVGNGVRRQAAEERAARLGVASHICFAGTRSDVAALLDASDVHVTASENEGFGIAPLEAMARRLPVVAVAGAHTAVAEFVDDGATGVLVPDPSADALAAAVEDVLADPERSARLGRSARAAARGRSFTETTRRVEETYATVTAGRRR
jgi:glycosyltransferase involved in cell wall biosynthesis